MLSRFLAAAVCILLAQIVSAQENLVPKEQFKTTDATFSGWKPNGKAGINASLNSSSHVVGQTDGTAETYGLDLKIGYDFRNESSEWINTVQYAGAATKTSALARYIKSSDALKLESLYLYHLSALPRIGPYARASAALPIFFGEDVRATPTAYSVQRLDGTASTVTSSTFVVTQGFKPLTSKESVGGFWQVFDDGNVRIDARLGVGAQQESADGQFAVTATDPSGVVTVTELRSLSQLGVEAALGGHGKIEANSGWEAGVESLTPFVTNKTGNDNRDAIRLTNIEAFAKLSSNITAWAAVSYDYKLTIKPQLIDRTQQSHVLVLNMNYNLF